MTLVLGALLAVNLIDSPTGRALRAIHDSEVASRVLGIDVARYKLIAFVLSAVYAAVAGAYLALFDGLVTPATAGFLRSIEFVTMAVLGGLGSILGSIVGAALLTLLPQVLTVFHDYEHIALGADHDRVHDLPARRHRAEPREPVPAEPVMSVLATRRPRHRLRRRARRRRRVASRSSRARSSPSSGRTAPARPRCST